MSFEFSLRFNVIKMHSSLIQIQTFCFVKIEMNMKKMKLAKGMREAFVWQPTVDHFASQGLIVETGSCFGFYKG